MSRAVYLESEGGEVIWLTTDETPMHGRGLTLRGTLPRLRVGSAYEAHDDGLWMEEGSLLNWRDADVWDPPALDDGPRLVLTDLRRYLKRVRSFVDGMPAPRGLGIMLGSILGRARGGEAVETPMLRLARPAIAEILDAGRGQDVPGALAAAEDLIGLGEGLTPSGDDFVGGLLFGLAGLQAAYAVPQGVPPDLPQQFLERTRRRTNRISHALLRDDAAGMGPEPLHRYWKSLLMGETVATISRLASDVVRIGHSTGWDCLTGLWAALSIVTAESGAPGRRRSNTPEGVLRGTTER